MDTIDGMRTFLAVVSEPPSSSPPAGLASVEGSAGPAVGSGVGAASATGAAASVGSAANFMLPRKAHAGKKIDIGEIQSVRIDVLTETSWVVPA